jgi:hypothetical protein
MRNCLKVTGYLAVGMFGVQAAHGQADSKPWSVSAAVRGFYDDNYATAPSTPAPGQAPKQNSYGVEFIPSAGFRWRAPNELTDFKADYIYSLRYYEDRVNSADHSHQIDLGADHKFGSERYRASFRESFVAAQEAQLLDPAIVATPLRSNGDNIRNLVSLNFQAKLTDIVGVDLGYSNSYYDYEATGPGSRSALLDRVEHLANVNARWQFRPTTVGLVGYQFGVTDQTSTDSLSGLGAFSPSLRDSRSHYVYLGADHAFSQKWDASARLGVQHTEYPNVVAPLNDSSTGPYADVSTSYSYAEDCTVHAGVRHTRTQTDVALQAAALAASTTLDAETTAIYGHVNHKFTAKLRGHALVQFQTSGFDSGGANNQRDDFFISGLNLTYEINKFLTAEAGYNYDRLNSDLSNRSFTRNRAYLGIRAKY